MRTHTPTIQLLPSTLAAFALYAATATAQDTTPPPTPPAVDQPKATSEPTEVDSSTDQQVNTPTNEVAPPALPGEEVQESATEEAMAQEEDFDGMRLNDAALNTVFEVLARDAGLSYFHNNRIAGEDFKVNGYLKEGDPVTQMEDLAFNNALTLHRRGNTIYALTSDQLNQLPATEWTYQMRYLRSENMKEHIRELVSPLLSPNTGIVNYEPKTNTLIVIDTPYKIQRVQNLLERIDKAKGQIVVEIKIYSVNQSLAQDIGFDWSDHLSSNGESPIAGTLGLNSILGLPQAPVVDSAGSLTIPAAASDLVFSPNRISTVLTALNAGGVTKLKNNPVLITEDNETANISIIDRIPIVTTETTNSSTGSEPTVTEEVRYKVDEEDSTDPEDTREIGTTISVTPTLLPDGTIRLKMRPRNAGVTRNIETPNGNTYPEVRESTITTTARIPDGHSLILGGFYSEKNAESENKVPLLGDIPGVQFFFKSKTSSKIQSSLIFVVTPSSYNPANHNSHHRTHNRIIQSKSISEEVTTFENQANRRLHKSNLKRTLKNIKKESGLESLKMNKPTSQSNKRFRVHR